MTDLTDADLSRLLEIVASKSGYTVTNNVARWQDFGGLELVGLVEVSNHEDSMSGLRAVNITDRGREVAAEMLEAGRRLLGDALNCKE